MRQFVISEEDLKNFIRTSKLYSFACECVLYSPSEEELEVTEENLASARTLDILKNQGTAPANKKF